MPSRVFKCIPREVEQCYVMIYWRLMTELLSLMAVMSEGLGFNLCVAPFLNVCVLNLPQGVKDGGCQSLVRGVILELDEGRLSWGRSEDEG